MFTLPPRGPYEPPWHTYLLVPQFDKPGFKVWTARHEMWKAPELYFLFGLALV